MLYSIGYQRMKDASELTGHLKSRGITILVDVRSKPYSRKPGFSKPALCKALRAAGIAYSWLGYKLGGLREIEERHIRDLAAWQQDKTACLMCMEHDPATCHRHYEIGRRLKKYGIEIRHIT